MEIAEGQLTLEAVGATPPFADVLPVTAGAPSRADGKKPVSLTAAEAGGMGDLDPDPATDAAAERLRTRRIAYRFIKRAFDIAFSAAALVCLSWLYLVVAIAIKLDDPDGPVFFVQERVGRDGKRFRMWKFRSMCSDAESKLAALQAQNEKDGPVFKMAEDPRVTRVGRFIRKTSIDELPQFANVLMGHMSIVGPRPGLPKEVAAYTPRQRQRLLVKPGITCYWQTRRNRDSISFDEWVELDLLYIKRCSIWSDFKLIIQTVGVVLTAQGELMGLLPNAVHKMAPNRFPILNTYVNALSLDETVAEVEGIIARGIPTQHVVVNASKVNLMEADSGLAEIVNACPLINADGASIVWAAKKLGVPLSERVTGIDLFLRLVEVAAEKNYGIYLFGAREEVVTKVKAVFEEKYPALRIVGFRNGYFTETDETQILSDMAASGADMMFVAFSSPKKEYWVHKHLDTIGIPFVMGVGGSFDVVAGVTDRAPKWMQDHGLEWFYRFVQEPGRLWKRYIIGNAKFVLLTFKYKLTKKGERQNG